jgi:hypothetical protein
MASQQARLIVDSSQHHIGNHDGLKCLEQMDRALEKFQSLEDRIERQRLDARIELQSFKDSVELQSLKDRGELHSLKHRLAELERRFSVIETHLAPEIRKTRMLILDDAGGIDVPVHNQHIHNALSHGGSLPGFGATSPTSGSTSSVVSDL